MKVINIFGGPGVGKSTIAAEIFVKMKKNNFSIELKTEYVKDLIYQDRFLEIESDQFYILAKQNHKLNVMLRKKIEYVVTDSPLMIQTVYNRCFDRRIFDNTALYLHNLYENINILLVRNPNYLYEKTGRLQDQLEEAQKYDVLIKNMLDHFNIQYFTFENNLKVSDQIISKVLELRVNES